MSGSISTNTDFNTGNDCHLILILDVIGRVDLRHVTGFSATQIVKPLRVARLNAPPIGRDIPAGWDGQFELDRGDGTGDNLAALFEQTYWSGVRLPSGQIFQYISETNGGTSTYLFEGVALNLMNAGNWVQDQVVKQTVKFFASRRRKI